MSHQSLKVYLVAVFVFVLSFIIAWTLPTTDLLQALYSIPGVFALCGIVFQAIRDQAAHERRLQLQNNEQGFTLGAASHMANVAFDKHTQFCEQYLAKMSEGLTELFEQGPSKDAFKFYAVLTDTRRAFLAWITKDLKDKITPFEQVIYEIGKNGTLMDALPPGDKRSRYVDAMYEAFSKLTKIPRENLNEKDATELILNHLQELLGVEQLSGLRAAILKKTADNLMPKKS